MENTATQVSYEEHISKRILSKHDQQCINTIISCWPPNPLTGTRPRAKKQMQLVLASFFSLRAVLHLLTQHLPVFQLCVYIFFSAALYILYIYKVISMTSSFVYIIYIYEPCYQHDFQLCLYIWTASSFCFAQLTFLLASIQTAGHSTGKESMCYISGISIQHYISVEIK